MNLLKTNIILLMCCLGVISVQAQDAPEVKREKKPRAWEFGVGASIYHLNRFSLIDFRKNEQGDFELETEKKDVLFGGNVHVARELNDHFALDLQSFIGFTRDKLKTGKDNRWVLKSELGLQWRLGKYFNSRYIDPYFRAGVGYMYKNFNIVYDGVESFEGKEVLWSMDNLHNKQGADKKHMLPISIGAGVNMWLNDRVGIGMQCKYIVKPYKYVSNDVEGTVSLMWRFGGASKKAKPIISYVEVERIVEIPVEVVKEVAVFHKPGFCNLFDNIYFEFDSNKLDKESEGVLDQIAKIMNKNSDRRFLIIGYTDAKGNPAYNLNLSERRAKAVVEALKLRGVPAHVMKYRGVGKQVAFAGAAENTEVREGDRKVCVEVITNEAYWNFIP